ncbi:MULTISPECIES: hypothetical protein [unclassified Flavobacterium]|uniref:hypothetical protein n=1 Tax=unclassified Flavobacterium TaxID=196869 RepID=UPI00096935FE|nr:MULTISPECIES: hypothetical protein [unclassified Flavobacterium]MBN9283845.1 hypothetical protein [Flavobacterium sp.]OJV68653.1 MAG: hypothetical protein BGO42_02140 [Flavobacterium sp. 40-81]
MKKILLFVFIALHIGCFSQKQEEPSIHLTISPVIDREKEINKKIITALIEFLATKNQSSQENKYWLKSDFEKYKTPYTDLVNIENSKFGTDFYKPTLMEIIDTKTADCKIVKIAYIGYNPQTKDNTIRCIYNIVANHIHNDILFSHYLDYATRDYTPVTIESIHYFISPLKKLNSAEADQQKLDIVKICKFFNCSPIPVHYYSCTSPQELFRIKGFDYNPLMYVSETGGLAESNNTVFSGNNADCYTHEIVHIYVNKLFPNAPAILNEGIATYLGGSGLYNYDWHKNNLKKFLQKGNTIDFQRYIDNPFERFYIDNETPVPYMIGALICERALKRYDREKLLQLLQNKNNSDIRVLLREIGITPENMNAVLLQEL